jgi:prevent-host-death family protein
MKIEIGAYEAKTKLPELLREVKRGKEFTITNRGIAVADLVPTSSDEKSQRAAAVAAMKKFMNSRRPSRVNIRKLIEEGRD